MVTSLLLQGGGKGGGGSLKSVLLLHTTISPGEFSVACRDLQLDLAAPSLATTGLFCLQEKPLALMSA